MGWIKTFKNADGTFDSFEWSFNDVIKVNLLIVVAYFLMFIAIGIIIPYFILLIYPITYVLKQRYTQYIVGLVVCALWMIDYMFLGINYSMYVNSFPEFYRLLTINNFTIILILIPFMIYDDQIFNFFHSTGVAMLASWGFFILAMIFVYFKLDWLFDLIPRCETPIFAFLE